MSELGQKRTFTHLRLMSALPPKADIVEHDCHVRFVPKADSCSATKRGPPDHTAGVSKRDRHLVIEKSNGCEPENALVAKLQQSGKIWRHPKGARLCSLSLG